MGIPELNGLTIREKVGQLFFIGIPGPSVDEQTRDLLDDVRPGGVCLFARNIKELEQTRALNDELRKSLPIAPLISIDQEGGRVDRLRRILEPMPAASQLRSADDAGKLGSLIGEALSLLGLNMNFAPVVDVIDAERSSLANGLQTRGLGTDTQSTIAYASRFLAGLREFGILGCLKHFPGLAASTVDSHEELPMVAVPASTLESVDLAPYRALLPANPDAAVMIAHAAFPLWDLQESDANGNLLPSSLSKNFVAALLREKLNFNGLAITDDLEMGAILRNYGIAEACKMAVTAGADMLAICASVEAIREGFGAVLKAAESGQIEMARLDEAVTRIFDAKRGLAAAPRFDRTRLDELSQEIKDLKKHLN